MKERARVWLENQGYEIVTISQERGSPTKKSARGRRPLAATEPDIKARKGTKYYFVEAKGDPSSTAEIQDQNSRRSARTSKVETSSRSHRNIVWAAR